MSMLMAFVVAWCIAPNFAVAEEANASEPEAVQEAAGVANHEHSDVSAPQEEALSAGTDDDEGAEPESEAVVDAHEDALSEAVPVASSEQDAMAPTEEAKPARNESEADPSASSSAESSVVLEAAAVEPNKELVLTSAATKTVISKKGWTQDADGIWYWSSDGKNAVHGWQSISGVWYYFDDVIGAMKCNETFVVSGRTYVANASGACPASRWVQVGGQWYLTDSSCACRSGWVKSGGTWYYLDPKAKAMKANETFVVDAKTYVANASGACPSGRWVLVGQEWYLTDSSCACRSGWVKSGGSWYYLDPKTKAMIHDKTFVVAGKTYVAEASGVCRANAWVKAAGKWYLTDSSCACRSGWVVSGGTTYYLDPKTKAMKEDESFTVDGKVFLATSSGSIAGGTWNETSQGWYYTSNTGSVATGWNKIEGVWYYFDASGLMKQGELFSADGKMYIARRDGSCPSNAWVENAGKWYRTDASCAVRTGWWSTGVTVYYFDSKGASVTGEQTIKGERYFFFAPMGGLARSEYVTLSDGTRAYVNGDGVVCSSGPTYGGNAKSGWSKYDGDWYYIDAETGKPTTGWITYKDKRYWLDPEGVMVTGSRLIDGKAYWFSLDGDLVKELDGTADDLLKAAEDDIGYDVNSDKLTGSLYGRWYQENCNPWKGSLDYGEDGVAWCVMAVSYWMYEANVGGPGIPHAGCETIAQYARREGLVVAPEDVDLGQLILYDWDEDGEPDHIGIVEQRVSDRKVKSVEGNTSDQVASRTRDIDSIYCGVKAYLV